MYIQYLLCAYAYIIFAYTVCFHQNSNDEKNGVILNLQKQ